MSAHTPGPWRYYTEPQPNGCPIVGNGRGLMVCMCAHSVHQTDQCDEALANARLIAAAPDLLEVLIKIADFDMRAGCGCSHPCRCDTEYSRAIAFDTLRDIARAAIAKAEGAS